MTNKLNHNFSFVIPIYNESLRVNIMLNQILDFIKSSNLKNIQFIFVNDGSSDNTDFLINKFLSKNEYLKKYIKVIQYYKNKGKGFALKQGVLEANNKYICTTDVDFSVPLNYIEDYLLKDTNFDKFRVHIGDRGHFNSKIKSTFIRKFLGTTFNKILGIFFNFNTNDTQCGFKIYEKSVAKKIFDKISIFGFAHDIEVLLICNLNKIKVNTFPVDWTHKPNSKVNLIKDSTLILLNVIKLKLSNKKKYIISE